MQRRVQDAQEGEEEIERERGGGEEWEAAATNAAQNAIHCSSHGKLLQHCPLFPLSLLTHSPSTLDASLLSLGNLLSSRVANKWAWQFLASNLIERK